jgi:PAS domain S-box-containing protein
MADGAPASASETHGQPYSVTPPPPRDQHTHKRGPAPRRLAAALVANVALGGVYVVAGKLGLQLAFVHASATPVWPPTGIAVAALLVLGYRLWPGIMVGAFLVNLITAGSAASSLGIAAGNTLEGLLAAYLVNRFANGPRVFDRPSDILKFVLLAGVLSPSVSATFGVTTLTSLGHADWSRYGSIWFTWWLGDMGGAILVAPLLVLWLLNPRPGWSGRQILEVGLLLVALLVMGEVVFGGMLSIAARKYPVPFLMVPLLVWAALRFGRRETATLMFLVSGSAIWGTLRGLGPFAREGENEALLLLLVFNGVMAVMALTLAAAVDEHKRAEKALQLAHDELERRVRERTAELAEANVALRGQIEERQQVEERLRQNERQLLEAEKLARLGAWSWDVATNAVVWSEQLYRIHGVTGNFDGTYLAFLDRVHPDDRVMTDRMLSAAVQDRQPFDFYHRIVRPDGTERILCARGEAVRDGAGNVVRVVGTGQDVTELKRAEEALRRTHEELERRVHERTRELAKANAALQEKIADLEKLEEMVVGRELKMIALEKELDRLRQTLKGSEGRP